VVDSDAMSSQLDATTTTTDASTVNDDAWKGGVVAGLAGGAVMGVMLSVVMTPVIQVAIPSMYGLSGGLAGWVVHLSHSAVLGLGFVALAAAVPGATRSTLRSAAFGAGYGVVLWVLLAVLVMPIWLSAVGSPANPPLPNVNLQSLVGHLAYGVVLGVVFPRLESLW
jgi:hypothetical protein